MISKQAIFFYVAVPVLTVVLYEVIKQFTNRIQELLSDVDKNERAIIREEARINRLLRYLDLKDEDLYANPLKKGNDK